MDAFLAVESQEAERFQPQSRPPELVGRLRTVDWASAARWAAVVAVLYGARLLVGNRPVIPGAAASAEFLASLACLSLVLSVAALTRDAAQGDVRFLGVAVGAAGYGIIQAYAGVVGMLSPLGFAAAPAPDALAILGDVAALGLLAGIGLSVVARAQAHFRAVAAAVLLATLGGALSLAVQPAFEFRAIQAVLDAAVIGAAVAVLSAVAAGGRWKSSKMRPFLLSAAGLLIAIELPLPGVATQLGHQGVSFYDIGSMAAIAILVAGGLGQLRSDFQQLARTNIELAQLNLQLTEAKRRAESAARAREVFIGLVSHELRTPLNAIRGFSQLMARSDRLFPENRRRLDFIVSSAERLAGRIDDVLALTSAGSDPNLAKSALDLKVLVEAQATTFATSAREKGVGFSCDIESAVANINGDLLMRGISKVLDNAVRYSAMGTVRVVGRSEGDCYRILVSDEGRGFPTELLDHLLEGFTQADEGTRRTQGGLGMGLAVTQRALSEMDGKLEIDSEPGRGTTVSLLFPQGTIHHS